MKKAIAGIIIGIIGIGTIGCANEIVEPPATIIIGAAIEQTVVLEPVVITRAEFETIKPGTCDEIAFIGPNLYAQGIEDNKILKVSATDTTKTLLLYCESLWFLN